MKMKTFGILATLIIAAQTFGHRQPSRRRANCTKLSRAARQ